MGFEYINRINDRYGCCSDEEWQAYYKVQRRRIAEDVAIYLGWGYKGAKEYEAPGEEFDQIVDYVIDNFNVDVTIHALIDKAYKIITQKEKGESL